MTHVTCRLTAKNRDQLRNRTLGNRVWTTFLLLLHLTQLTITQTISDKFVSFDTRIHLNVDIV